MDTFWLTKEKLLETILDFVFCDLMAEINIT